MEVYSISFNGSEWPGPHAEELGITITRGWFVLCAKEVVPWGTSEIVFVYST